jgi:hypothetical protein
MATLVTPEDVLGSGVTQSSASRARTSADTLDLLRSPTVLGAIDPEARTKLKCATKNNWPSRYSTAVAAIVIVGLACWGITAWIPHPAVPVSASAVRNVDGLTIFAAFFVAALGIERLLEPLSNAILPKAATAQTANDAIRDAKSKTESFLSAAAYSNARPSLGSALSAEAGETDDGVQVEPSAVDPSEANNAIKNAAAAKEKLNVLGFQRTTAFWTIATCLGMAAAAAMNLYFLNTVGITVGTRWEEVLATGLIIGAGTKPLHDLVALISAKSTAAAGDSA